MYVSIDKIKKHLNIDSDFKDDDMYLMSLSEVAEQLVQRHIGRDLAKLADDNGGCVPSPLEHAMLLMIGTLYSNRESITFGSAQEVPLAYTYILQLYENYDGWF